MIKSQPINIIRYKNGTLIKLTPSAEGFMSYDYNVISGAATYAPEQIDIEAKAEGDLTVEKWEYSYDGEAWYEVINGEDGIAINDNVLSIVPSSSLFSDTQSTVTFKCTGSDGEHYDTVMITRHVDPLYIYRTTNANIEQTNSKIRLIASDEQLNQFDVGRTMMSKVAEIEQTANGIKSTVETKYATKVYADASAGTAESNAKNYAKTYTDTKETTLRSEISQTATGIRSEVVMKDGFEESVGSIIEQNADSIRLKASNISWSATNSSMTQDGTLTCQNAIIGGTIEVGKAQNKAGQMIVYDTNNIETARFSANGMDFKPDGVAVFHGTTAITDTVTVPTKTVITDGAFHFYQNDTEFGRIDPGYAGFVSEKTGELIDPHYFITMLMGEKSGLAFGDNTTGTGDPYMIMYSKDTIEDWGLDYAISINKPVKFMNDIQITPTYYTKAYAGWAVYDSEGGHKFNSFQVTLFGPFVHVEIDANIFVDNREASYANRNYFRVIYALPRAATIPESKYPYSHYVVYCPDMTYKWSDWNNYASGEDCYLINEPNKGGVSLYVGTKVGRAVSYKGRIRTGFTYVRAIE
jgi:hypothetical protein